MKFNTGEFVKVIIGDDNGKQLIRDGQYLHELPESDGHRVQMVPGIEISVPATNVYKHQFLLNGDADAESAACENLKMLASHWEHAADELLKEADRRYEVVDGHTLKLLDGCVTIEPAIITSRRIGKFVEMPGWSVTEWTFENNYPHAPDESIDHELGRSDNVHDVIKLALQAVFRATMECYYACEWCVPDARDM